MVVGTPDRKNLWILARTPKLDTGRYRALVEKAQAQGFDVSVADDRTLLAMKCAAVRTAADAADIRVLAARLDLRSSARVLDVVLAYYPPERLPIRTRA